MRFVVLLGILLFALPVQAQVEYFVEASVSNESPFVGQQIVYRFRLYSRVSRTNRGSIIDPVFDGFWKREFGAIRQYTESVNGQFYEVKERSFALFPSYAGELLIEPSTFVLLPEPERAGEVLMTDAIAVQVRPLPARGEITGFDGAVGLLELQPTVDRQTTMLGEPVTLRLVVRGTGNMEQLPAPPLPENEIWRMYRRPSTYRAQEIEGVVIGEKAFEWLLVPQQTGQQPLPVITVTYFDLDSQSYQSLSTTAINVEVQPATETAALQPVVIEAAPLSLKPVPSSLGASMSHVDVLFWLLWLVPPAGYIWVWQRQRRIEERRRNMVRYRRSEALVRAERALAAANRASPERRYKIVQNSILGYFADKLDIEAGTIHYQDIEPAMARHGLDEGLQTQLMTCLAMADEGLYAPFEAVQADRLVKSSAQILSRVDAQWKAV